jgi:anti-anti-sigma factor
VKPFEVIEAPPSGESRYRLLTLRGHLDAHTLNEFETFMESAIEQGGVRYLLDIKELNHISRAGIGAMEDLAQRLRRSDGEIVFLRPTPEVLKILEKLHYTKIFRVAYSREEAERLLGA